MRFLTPENLLKAGDRCITQFASMSFDSKFVELTDDALIYGIILYKFVLQFLEPMAQQVVVPGIQHEIVVVVGRWRKVEES